MRKQEYKHLQIFLLLTVVLCLASSPIFINKTAAAQKGSSATTDLSKVNWDEEESPEDPPAQKIEDLSSVNWNEEDTEDKAAEDSGETKLSALGWEDEDTEDDPESSEGLQTMRQEDIDRIESRERMIHIFGFMLFIGYILGGIVTAFITRNQKIALAYPPELLILLHTFWPLELLLLPFFGKSSR